MEVGQRSSISGQQKAIRPRPVVNGSGADCSTRNKIHKDSMDNNQVLESKKSAETQSDETCVEDATAGEADSVTNMAPPCQHNSFPSAPSGRNQNHRDKLTVVLQKGTRIKDATFKSVY